MAKELVFLFEKTKLSAGQLSNSVTLADGRILELKDLGDIMSDVDLRAELAKMFSYGDARLKAEIFAGFYNDDYACIRIFSSVSSNHRWHIRMTPRMLENGEFDVLFKNKLKRKFIKLKGEVIDTDLNPFFKIIGI